MSLLARVCPRCKGRGRIPNLLLPGKHTCRRCGGAGEIPTWAARALWRLTEPACEED